MFYSLDFTRTQYRRRKAFQVGYLILALMLAGVLCLISFRVKRMSELPTLARRLDLRQADVQTVLQLMDDWTTSRQRFQEIMPFWFRETAVDTPVAFLETIVTNVPSWEARLAPRRLSMTVHGKTELDLELWFQGARDKAVVLAEVRHSLTNGLAAWAPRVMFEEERQLAGRERIGVQVVCTPRPHRWPDGMKHPPDRLVNLIDAMASFHDHVWAYKPLKGEGLDNKNSLAVAMDQVLLDAKSMIGDAEEGKALFSEWQAYNTRAISPLAVLAKIRFDLHKRGIHAVPAQLEAVEAAWKRLADRWWRPPRAIDCQPLNGIERELAAILGMRIPAHQTFSGFNEWMAQYRMAFTNAWTCEDIRINGRDLSRLKDLYREAVTDGGEPVIECQERALSDSMSRMGYSDWILRLNEDRKAGGRPIDLPTVVQLARKFNRAVPGIRLTSVEMKFKEQQALAGAWQASPESSVLKGLLPWQVPCSDSKPGGLP